MLGMHLAYLVARVDYWTPFGVSTFRRQVPAKAGSPPSFSGVSCGKR
jgi:hypothetical protein